MNGSFASNPVVAHRGAFKKNSFPENSIASLREAIRLKCAGSEFDVRMTLDDSLVINHDPKYHGLDIEKSTYRQLTETTLSNGEAIPTLREYLLSGMKDNKATRLVVEIKPSETSKERGQIVTTKVLDIVTRLRASAMVCYISFDYDIVKTIHQLDPAAITQYLAGDRSPDQLKADGISGADYHISVFKQHPKWIDEAKAYKLILNVWTVNSTEDLKWALDQKFDYITTNEPEELLQMLSSR